DERPAGVVLVQLERVVGEAVLPLLDEELHRLELAQVVRDAGLGDAHQRDQLADVERRLRDEPQDAKPGRVAERAIGLGERLHINASAYLDSGDGASQTVVLGQRAVQRERNQAAVRPNPSSRATLGSQPSTVRAASGPTELRRCWPVPGA